MAVFHWEPMSDSGRLTAAQVRTVASALIVLAAGACSTNNGDASVAISTVPSSATQDDAAPTPSTVLGPTTSPGSDPPTGAPTVAVANRVAAHGEAFTVTVTCVEFPSDVVDVAFDMPGPGGSPIGQVIGRQSGDSTGFVFEGELSVPYWLPPGEHDVLAWCSNYDDVDNYPAAVTVEVTEAARGRWDRWRPDSAVEFVAADPPETLNGSTWFASADSTLAVRARCAAGTDTAGARFVVWGTHFDPSWPSDERYFAIEYPATATSVPDGIEIAADISLNGRQTPQADKIDSSGIAVLCTATTTPFEPAINSVPITDDANSIVIS